jgi:uncharacterized protein YjbJ (UPF0337 family)
LEIEESTKGKASEIAGAAKEKVRTIKTLEIEESTMTSETIGAAKERFGSTL